MFIKRVNFAVQVYVTKVNYYVIVIVTQAKFLFQMVVDKNMLNTFVTGRIF